MSKDMRRWPWNDSYEDDNYLEPYDEYEEIKRKGGRRMGRPIADGQCYWRRHRSQWGVWKKKRSADGFEDDEFIRDFTTMDAAKAFVYSENGWI